MTSFLKVALAGALLSMEHSLVGAQKGRDEDDDRRANNGSYFKDNKGQMHLKIDNNKEFRIMQLTDLHFGESKERDDSTVRMIKDIIRKEDPDFMAITGDLISGQMYNQSEEDSLFWEHYFHEFFAIMNDYDIPWGFVPGFHDYETRWTNGRME